MIFIDADWKGLGGPQRVGVARTSTVRGRETLAFSFDPEWLPQRGGILLDPLLLATTGWHYPALGGMPGILQDSAPDRWGRILMRRRETENARRERRPERSLTDTDSRCGLLTTEARSESFSRHGRTFLIRRFDRDGPARIHFASAMCLLGCKDGDGAGTGIGYLDLADLILRISAAPGEDLRELWCRIVFGILVKNTDDHLRNHGFLLGRDGWRLAPIFDVNPTPWGTALALNINETSNLLDPALALEIAPHFRVHPPDANRFMATCRKALSGWKTMARDRDLPRSEITLMARAFDGK